MTPVIRGLWYDGRTSRACDATLTLTDDGGLTVDTGDTQHAAGYAEVRVSDRLGNAPRRIEFPDGAAFETTNNDAVDRVIRKFRPGARPWLHRFEASVPLMAGAIVVTIVIGWATFRYAIPAASAVIAGSLPPELLGAVGDQTFEALDAYGLESTKLPPERRERIAARFGDMVDDTILGDRACRLEFRSAEKSFGPNAFALPPCRILVTDELVRLAEHDDEIYAVLAHELGHIHHRHSMRRVVQDAFLAFILMMITGDATQVSAAIAAVPVLFLELGYARGFEREADRFALDYMVRERIALHRFPDILERMGNWMADKACDGEDCRRNPKAAGEGPLLDYLSTHPSTAERSRMFSGDP